FFKSAKIGLVYDDYPQFSSVTDKVLLPALKAAGADVAATFAHGIHDVPDLGPGAGTMTNAVLHFRTAGVTRVMFFDAYVSAWVLFARAADEQSWQPVYGLSSQDSPEDAIESG